MAKTIMVSDEAYSKLKSIKEREDKSYSEVIIELVEIKKSRNLRDLKRYFSVFKGDTEYKEIMKEVRSGWARWTKKYV